MWEKTLMLPKLDLRKIKASMPEHDWEKLEEICITYKMDINKLVAGLLQEYLHSPDGELHFENAYLLKRYQKPESD